MTLTDKDGINSSEIRVLDRLAHGGQAHVYKGLYKKDEVAIKIFKSSQELDLPKFKKLLRLKDHKNLIKLHGLCENFHYDSYCTGPSLIMELCRNSLYNVIHDSTFPIKPNQVLKFGAEISSGMRHLHRKGIIHRDLKSANILIGYDNHLKISDLDSHTIGNAQAATISFQGTVNWMAPELIRGDKCSQKVDTWSFGIILWELLTRQIPYADVPSQQIMWEVGNHRLATRIPSSCPAAVGAILAACTDFNPEERPSFDKILKMIQIAEMDMENITPEMLDVYRDEWQRESNQILATYRSKREESVQKQTENGLLIINQLKDKLQRLTNDMISGRENGDTEYVFNMMSQLPSSMMNQLNYQSNFSTPPMSRQGSSRRQRRTDMRKSRRRSSGMPQSNSTGLKNSGFSSDDDADREMSDNRSIQRVQSAVTISRNLKYKPNATYSASSDSGNDVSSHSPRSSSNEDEPDRGFEDIVSSENESLAESPITKQPAPCPNFVRTDKERATIHSMSSASPDEGYLSPKGTIRLNNKSNKLELTIRNRPSSTL